MGLGCHQNIAYMQQCGIMNGILWIQCTVLKYPLEHYIYVELTFFIWTLLTAIPPMTLSFNVDSKVINFSGTPWLPFSVPNSILSAGVKNDSVTNEWKDALHAWAWTCHRQAIPLKKNGKVFFSFEQQG